MSTDDPAGTVDVTVPKKNRSVGRKPSALKRRPSELVRNSELVPRRLPSAPAELLLDAQSLDSLAESIDNGVTADVHRPHKKVCHTESIRSDMITDLPRRFERKSHRHLKRSVSAVTAEKDQKLRIPVRRTSSECGNRECLMPPGSGRRSRHHRNSARRSKSSVSRTPSGVVMDGSWDSRSKHTSLTELVAVELGLAEVPGISPKESRRRRVVFAVALIALALLTASVLLVAITLFLSPTVDAVVRKENENYFRVATSTTLAASTSSSTQLLPTNDTIVSTGHPG